MMSEQEQKEPEKLSLMELAHISEEDAIDFVSTKIKTDRSILTKTDQDERALIHWAALRGRINLIDLLLKQPETPIDAGDNVGTTPLILAVMGGQLDITAKLIDMGAAVNNRNLKGNSALQSAISKGGKDIVKFLLSRGADLNMQDGFKNTPVHRAASMGKVDILQMLLEHVPKPDLTITNSEGDTALHVACADDQSSCAMLLVHQGASVEILNKEEKSPLDLCKPPLRNKIKTHLNI